MPVEHQSLHEISEVASKRDCLCLTNQQLLHFQIIPAKSSPISTDNSKFHVWEKLGETFPRHFCFEFFLNKRLLYFESSSLLANS